MFTRVVNGFKKTFLLLTLPLLFVSCGSLIEVNGLTNVFDKLSETQKALVVPFESFDAAEAGFVIK